MILRQKIKFTSSTPVNVTDFGSSKNLVKYKMWKITHVFINKKLSLSDVEDFILKM